jgi:uncharacterized membrane protein
MEKPNTGKLIVLTLASLMLVRGILILFAGEGSSDLNNILGVGGLTNADAQFGAFGSILRIAQLIEGRFWIILAFPLFYRLAWGRDVAVLVAGLGVVVQIFRLLAGGGAFAVVWIVIYVVIALLFSAEPHIKAHFVQAQDASTQPR